MASIWMSDLIANVRDGPVPLVLPANTTFKVTDIIVSSPVAWTISISDQYAILFYAYCGPNAPVVVTGIENGPTAHSGSDGHKITLFAQVPEYPIEGTYWPGSGGTPGIAYCIGGETV